MDPLFIIIPIVLGVIALYLLFTRRATHRGGNLRTDATERPELRGEEQRKRRVVGTSPDQTPTPRP
jgi:hypothetical protein